MLSPAASNSTAALNGDNIQNTTSNSPSLSSLSSSSLNISSSSLNISSSVQHHSPSIPTSRSPQLTLDDNNGVVSTSQYISQQPQLTVGYVPPPNFPGNTHSWPSSVATTLGPQEQIHDYHQQLDENDYEIKGGGCYVSDYSSLTQNRISYPAPQNSPLTPAISADNVQYQHHRSPQSRTWKNQQAQADYNNATVIPPTQMSSGNKSTGKSRRNKMVFILLFIVTIAVGIGVGIALSNGKDNGGSGLRNNGEDNSDGNNPITDGGSETDSSSIALGNTKTMVSGNIPTASVGLSSSISSPSWSTTAIMTTATTTTQVTSPTLAPNPSGNKPPPSILLPIRESCPDSFCRELYQECEAACRRDGDYNRCIAPCNGELSCVNNCRYSNRCFRGCDRKLEECLDHCP